jgi:hypothetical protein
MARGDLVVTGTSERQLHAALIFQMSRAGFILKAESEHALEFELWQPDALPTSRTDTVEGDGSLSVWAYYQSCRERLRVTTVERVEHEIYVQATLETWDPVVDGERPRDTPGADRWVALAASSINGAAVTALPQ